MNLKTFLLPFLVGALVAGTVVWFARAHTSPGGPGAAGHAPGAGELPASGMTLPGQDAGTGEVPPASLADTPAAHEKMTRLEQENEKLQAEVHALEQKVEELKPKPSDPKAYRFGVPENAPSFDAAKWDELAGHMKKLASMMTELKDEIVNTGTLSPKLQSQVQSSNMPLAIFAISVSKDLGDPMPNGAFTHPAVIANLIRSALIAAEDPLSRDQELSIATLGTVYLNEVQRSAENLSRNAPVMAKNIAEVDAKQRFIDSVKTVLTSSQRAYLFQPETEGRVGLDLLSPALVYVMRSGVPAGNRADLEKALLKGLLGQGGIEREDLSQYEWVAREWIDSIPGVLKPVQPLDEDLVFPHVTQMQRLARAQVDAIERVIGMGGLEPDQVTALRQSTTLLIPHIRQSMVDAGG